MNTRALAAWLAVRPASDCDALSLSHKGGARSARGMVFRVTALAERAGLKVVSPHTLRHSLPSEADLQAATERVSWGE